MISFNGLGFESMTGEPNTWNSRVSFEQALPMPRTAENVPDHRGIAAAFDLMDLEQERMAIEQSQRTREAIEEEERARHGQVERLMTQPADPSDEHLQAKLRHAKRRETNLRYKNQNTDA